MDLGMRIYELRNKAGLTQEQLGEEQMFFRNMKVYVCLFHGGIIK